MTECDRFENFINYPRWPTLNILVCYKNPHFESVRFSLNTYSIDRRMAYPGSSLKTTPYTCVKHGDRSRNEIAGVVFNMTQRSKHVTKVQYLKWSGLGEIMTVEGREKVYSHI